jgi:WD40 repeat protein
VAAKSPLSDSATALAFSPTAPLLAIGTRGEQVGLLDVGTLEQQRRFLIERQTPNRHDPLGHRSIFGVAFTPDGSRLITGAPGAYLCIWDAATGHLVRRFNVGPTEPGDAHKIPSIPRGVNSIAVDPDGEWVVTAARGLDGLALRAWDLDSGIEITRLSPRDAAPPPPGATQIRVTPSRRVYALFGWELWALDALHRTAPRSAAVRCDVGSDVTSIAVDPCGNYVATGHRDGMIAIREANTHKVVMEFRGHVGGRPGPFVGALAWSPNGEWIASGSTDGFVRLWRVDR